MSEKITSPAPAESRERVAAHTPGPWRTYCIVEPGEDGDVVAIGVTCANGLHIDSDGDPADICEMANVDYYGLPEAQANACLIAAVPDLLAFVRQAIASMDRECDTSHVDDELYDEAKRVLTLATQEPAI